MGPDKYTTLTLKEVVWPILKSAWLHTSPFINIKITPIIIFISGVVLHYFLGGEDTQLTAKINNFVIYSISGTLLAYAFIFLVNMIIAPFRIHYGNLEKNCAKFWLHNVETHDFDNIVAALPLLLRQVKMVANKDNKYLKVHFNLFNGSVYRLKLEGKIEGVALLCDFDTNEHASLPALEIHGKSFNNLHHANSVEISFRIPLTTELETKLSGIKERQLSNHNSGAFDLRNTAIVLTAIETKKSCNLQLPMISMGEAIYFGL